MSCSPDQQRVPIAAPVTGPCLTRRGGRPRLVVAIATLAGTLSLLVSVVGCAGYRHGARAATPLNADSLRAAREGDLNVGDRVVLRVPGVSALTDTFVVRAGRVLELPEMPAIPLAGISRLDLQHHLRAELARFVHDTTGLEARSLMRIAVVGDVVNPGYYAVAPDALVGDVLMRAGGLARTAATERIVARRGPREIWPAGQLRDAMIAGKTLDELNLRAGDEIVVPAKRDWTQYAQTAALVAGAAVSVILIRHR